MPPPSAMAVAKFLLPAMAFARLPIEINKNIAHYLDQDKDIAAYRLICRATNDAVDADHQSFWRTLFKEKYDFSGGSSNDELRRVYQCRAWLLRCGTRHDFFRGHDKGEYIVVKMLRALIVESFHGTTKVDEHGRLQCKNHGHLIQFILNSRLLNNDRRAPEVPQGERSDVKSTLAAVKLVCSQFIFNLPDLPHNVFAFDESQFAVYQPSSRARIFTTDYRRANLEWLLHSMNFFRHHMMNEEAQTLFSRIDELDATQKPSPWREPLRQGPHPLPKYWKGTYSYLNSREVSNLRRHGPGTAIYMDKHVDEGKIQSLELSFATNSLLPTGRQLPWPPVFEQILHSLGPFATANSSALIAQGHTSTSSGASSSSSATVPAVVPTPQSIQFEGKGKDLDDSYRALGWLNALPSQGDIPGWQRITFMKHFNDDYEHPDSDNLWAYEGVVLPGGRLILGRWWFASDPNRAHREYNGPFILWAVDEPEMVDDDDDNQDGNQDDENEETEVEE